MKRQKNLEVKKATILAMVVNSLQILMVGVIVLYMYMTPGDIADLPLARALVAVAAAVVIWTAGICCSSWTTWTRPSRPRRT